eukprot:11181915-Lingulodinium_polyedra.AAC.1
MEVTAALAVDAKLIAGVRRLQNVDHLCVRPLTPYAYGVASRIVWIHIDEVMGKLPMSGCWRQ